MYSNRVKTLLEAYSTRPLEEYARIVIDISQSGGLTPEEVSILQTQLLSADAWMVVRHTGVKPVRLSTL